VILALLPVITVFSWLFSMQNTFKEWFDIVFFSGVRKIARHMTLLSNPDRKDHTERAWWEIIFEIWWGFSIKYFMPAALLIGMFSSMRTDFMDKYGGYPLGTNFIGWTIVIISLIIIIVPFFFCTTWEHFDYDVDQPFEMMAKKHFNDQQLKKKMEERDNKQEEDKENASSNDVNKSGIADNTSRSIVETENNLKLGEDDP
jgi:hypothetical protein